MIDEYIHPSNRSVHDNLGKLTKLQMIKLLNILQETSLLGLTPLLESVTIDDDDRVNYKVTLSGSYE